MTDGQIESITRRRNRKADIIHEANFIVSLSFSVAFWALLGGVWYWSIAFGALGACIEFSEKSQLELAALERNRRKRAARKWTAAAFMVVSILGSFGASVMRASSVVAQEKAETDTATIERRIASAESGYKALLDQQAALSKWTTEKTRLDLQNRIDKASRDLQVLYDRKEAREGTVREESVASMFEILSDFLGVENKQAFMVFLLMFASVAVKFGFWKTCRPLYEVEKEVAAREPLPEITLPMSEAPGPGVMPITVSMVRDMMDEATKAPPKPSPAEVAEATVSFMKKPAQAAQGEAIPAEKPRRAKATTPGPQIDLF